jgi:hypothetical protein
VFNLFTSSAKENEAEEEYEVKVKRAERAVETAPSAALPSHREG